MHRQEQRRADKEVGALPFWLSDHHLASPMDSPAPVTATSRAPAAAPVMMALQG